MVLATSSRHSRIRPVSEHWPDSEDAHLAAAAHIDGSAADWPSYGRRSAVARGVGAVLRGFL